MNQMTPPTTATAMMATTIQYNAEEPPPPLYWARRSRMSNMGEHLLLEGLVPVPAGIEPLGARPGTRAVDQGYARRSA
jgi:hypothetical protein